MDREEEIRHNIEFNRLKERCRKLEIEKQQMMEHIVFLKKNGYTYDQLNSKMMICDRCHKQILP